jgi:hypothetical protein
MGRATLFVNGTILTMDPRCSTAEALAIRDGRIVAFPSGEAVRGLRAEAAEVVDLGGRTLLPGFIDPHNHFAVAALQGFWADCRTPPLGTIADIQGALRAAAATTPAGEWVRGVGYHHAHLTERRHPTRGKLDEAVPDRPAFLLHFSHHQGVANSRALALAGITRATPDPPGGELGRDRAGEPTGCSSSSWTAATTARCGSGGRAVRSRAASSFIGGRSWPRSWSRRGATAGG